MEAHDWRRTFGQLLASDATGIVVRRFVEESLHGASGHLRGVILAARAALCYMQGPGHALEGLRNVDDAMQYLQDDPIERLGALITAHSLTWGAGLVSRSHRYHRELLQLRDSLPPDQVAPWIGRILLATGQYYMLCGEWDRAETTLREAVDWHREHVGPFSETDRRCYLALSLLDLGLVAIRGKHDPYSAELFLNESRQVMPPAGSRAAAVLYLEGLVALEKNQLERVIEIADQLAALGGLYRHMAHELQAEAALRRRDIQHCKDHALAGLRTAACIGDWVRVEQLDRLLHAANALILTPVEIGHSTIAV